MEKYSGLKTIGDGTYGSVVKAMNMKTGIWNFVVMQYRWNRCHKENEEEVLQMGCMCQFAWDLILDEVAPPEHSTALWSDSRKECASLCLWVSRHECLSVDEGKKTIVLWTLDQKYHVSDIIGSGIDAQEQLFS